MRLSAQPECSLALIQASMIACVISSIFSELIPNSRARLPAARAAAISISATIGRVSSICRSAVVVISEESSATRSKAEEQRHRGLDPVGDAAQLLDGKQSERIDRQQHGKRVLDGNGVGAGFGDAFHGVPPQVSGPPKSNATATPDF